jgi:hypothetical protein
VNRCGLPGDTGDMNRGHAEAHLRQLAEAELRRATAPTALAAGHAGRLPLVAQALIAVGAIDVDARHLGQQVGAPGRDRAQLGHRGGFLIRRQVTPAGVTSCGAGNPGDEDPVSLRAAIEHVF